jgi:hypothetical protein
MRRRAGAEKGVAGRSGNGRATGNGVAIFDQGRLPPLPLRQN